MESATPVLDAHRAALIEALARDVLRLAPRSVLDVGCGVGRLLAELASAGVAGLGVDPSARRAAEARARGLVACRADADRLPVADRAFERVVVRHVLHHLADPAPAVREAWRASRVGVVLAEPAVDASLASQRRMARLDELLSSLLARRGHVHHPYLGAGELLALVPDAAVTAETRAYGRLAEAPAAEVRALVAQAAGGEALGAEERDRLEELAAAAARGEVTYNGSVAVIVSRAGAER